MKKINTESRIICENPNSMFNYFAWPSVGRLPDGTLAMVCSGFRLWHVCPFGKAVICYSRDEGKTWTKPAVVIDTPEDDRDCGIVTFGGKVMINTFNGGVDSPSTRMREEVDSPHNFTYHMPVSKGYLSQLDRAAVDSQYAGSLFVLSDDGYEFGEIQRCPVQSPHGPCVLPDGRLFFVGKPMGTDGISRPGLQCYILDAEGNCTYLSSITEPEDRTYWEPHAIALEDRIIVQIRSDDPKIDGYRFQILQCESFDGGLTFTEPREITHGSPPHLMRHSSGVLISTYGYRRQPFGQRFMLSYDNGETWETDYILRDDGPDTDLGYPATVELLDGSLLTVYYQKPAGQNNPVIMQSIWRLPEHK